MSRVVFIHLPGAPEATPAGRLSFVLAPSGELLTSQFQYGRNYRLRAKALDVDPIALSLASETETPREPPNGLPLFGAIRDALPDAWGRRVIENQLRVPGNSLGDHELLDHGGSDRPGALDIRRGPDSAASLGSLPGLVDLGYLVDAAERIDAGEPVPQQLAAYFEGAPTLGGARPKAVVEHEGRHWIAKFPARNDPFDVPTIERATLELARCCNLDVPTTDLRHLADGRTIMLIERFDRSPMAGGMARRHMVSALTMLGVAEQDSPNQSYADLADIISHHAPRGRIQRDRLELFGRMIFNILVSNDDDHLRNHAFVFDPADGGWGLSPVYDVVPRSSLATERHLHLTVGPQGRLARLDNALLAAPAFGLHRREAAERIEHIYGVVRTWRSVFEGLGVPTAKCDRVANAFRRGDDIGLGAVRAAR